MAPNTRVLFEDLAGSDGNWCIKKWHKENGWEVKFDNGTLTNLQSKDEYMYFHFYNMKKLNISYGGLYPVMNPYFMRGSKETFRTDLCLIMDPFSFVINNKKIKLNNFYLDEEFNENMYSDFEKTIGTLIINGK